MNKLKLIRRTALALASAYLVGGFGVTGAVFKQTFRSHQTDRYSALAHWDFYENDYSRQQISFDSNGHRLLGHIYTQKEPSENARKGLVVFSHGIWSGPDDYMMVITWLVDHNYDVFTYSYTSYNGSDGSWAKGLPQAPLDLHAALTYIEQDETLSDMPKVLLGHSWGAYATCAALNFEHDVKGAAALSGFSDPMEISDSVASSMFGPASRSLSWMVSTVNTSLFHSASKLTAVDGINAADIPVLLIHGVNDDFIKFNESSIISHQAQLTNPNVEYLVLDDPKQSAHNNYFATPESTAYYKEVMEDFAKIEEQYKNKQVPDEVRKEFFSSVDIARANQPKDEFLNRIDQFFTKCLETA